MIISEKFGKNAKRVRAVRCVLEMFVSENLKIIFLNCI